MKAMKCNFSTWQCDLVIVTDMTMLIDRIYIVAAYCCGEEHKQNWIYYQERTNAYKWDKIDLPFWREHDRGKCQRHKSVES